MTEDPWAPIKADRSSSHTPTGAGFGYRQMATLLDAKKIVRPLLSEPHNGDASEGLSIVAAALVRGQGKTEGLHRRSVPVSRWETISAYEEAPLDRIGAVAEKRAGEANEASRRLGRALISLVQGGPEKARLDDDAAKKKTERWLEQFNRMVDGEFFDAPFWAEAAGDEANHRSDWRNRLYGIACDVFDTAIKAVPRTEVRRIRAIARARSFLDGQMRKWINEVQHGE
jgi:CRISPR system Cascade subunit CasA